jgi:hypothetical protein
MGSLQREGEREREGDVCVCVCVCVHYDEKDQLRQQFRSECQVDFDPSILRYIDTGDRYSHWDNRGTQNQHKEVKRKEKRKKINNVRGS